MQGYTDIPVELIEKDELEVKVYIESLSEFITECSTPMTIAIQGDWGSGKTSMMNMIRQNVDSKVVSIWFNTWQYSQFEMASYLSASLLSNFLEKIGAEPETKSWLKTMTRGASTVGKAAVIVATEKIVGETIAGNLNDHFSTTEAQDIAKNLESLRDKITDAVNKKLSKESGKDRIVVFVDDLDRLAPEKAVELLEVLKIFMDVPNCVFVLAVDYGVITQGLIKKFGDQVGHSKGKSFFDKIIQLPFTVPTSRYDISTYIKNLLSGVVGENVDENAIKAYREIADSSIGSNPRSLKRLFNSFILLNKVASKKEMFVDAAVKQQDKQRVLFATLCLQMAYPELYEFMIRNKDELEADFFENMKDLESIESNELVEKFKGVLLAEKVLNANDDNKLYYGKLSNFMEVFYNSLQLDDDLEDLSDEELGNLKNILSFSAITANTREEIQPSEISSKRHIYRLEFWTQFLEAIKGKSKLFQRVSAGTGSGLGSACGFRGIWYGLAALYDSATCTLWIGLENQDEGKAKVFFDELIKFKDEIERESGKKWEWNRMDNKKRCNIRSEITEVSIANSADWQKMTDFMISEINLMHKTLQPYLERVNQTLKNQP